jgi:hypothetical protein
VGLSELFFLFCGPVCESFRKRMLALPRFSDFASSTALVLVRSGALGSLSKHAASQIFIFLIR